MWELDYKESWEPKNWCFWTVVLEKTLESPLGCKEIKPVYPKGNQSWIFIGRTDADWPSDVKNWLIGKDPDAGKDRRQEEKGMIEDEMVGWHHGLNGNDFELTPGVGDGQESLVCCSPWVCKELDTSEWLNWTKLISVRKPQIIVSDYVWLSQIKLLPMWSNTLSEKLFNMYIIRPQQPQVISPLKEPILSLFFEEETIFANSSSKLYISLNSSLHVTVQFRWGRS